MGVRLKDLSPAARKKVQAQLAAATPTKAKKRTRVTRTGGDSASEGEAHLATRIKQMGLPAPQRQYQFHPDRKWAFDFAWPSLMLAVEVDGGTYMDGEGYHSSGQYLARQYERDNEATLMGWRILRFDTKQVTSDDAMGVLERAIEVFG